jgi:hypothetical protein
MKIHETPKSRRRTRVAVIVCGVILIVLDWLVFGGISDQKVRDQAMRAVIVAVLLAILELTIEIYIIATASGDDDVVSQHARTFIASNDKAIASEHLAAVLEQLGKALKVDSANRSYQIDNRSLAVDTYCSFWKLLVKKQKKIYDEHNRGKRKKRVPLPNACLEVRAIHATNIGIWLGVDLVSRDVLGAHKEFTKYGGIVKRILLSDAPGPQGQPGANYLEAMDNLVKHGASVGFLGVTRANHDTASRWDFMLVAEGGKFERNDNSLEALIWAKADPETGTPLAAVYSLNGRYSEHSKPLLEQWEEHRALSQLWRDAGPVDVSAEGLKDGAK